jgi:ubiquinone/menaquinone biosynthesis C-methylase UbiE
MEVNKWLYKQRLFEKWYIKFRRRLKRRIPIFSNEWWNYTNSITVKMIQKYISKPSLILNVGCGEGRLLKDLVKVWKERYRYRSIAYLVE